MMNVNLSPAEILPTPAEFADEQKYARIDRVPGRGRGVFAIRTIPAMTRVAVYCN